MRLPLASVVLAFAAVAFAGRDRHDASGKSADRIHAAVTRSNLKAQILRSSLKNSKSEDVVAELGTSTSGGSGGTTPTTGGGTTPTTGGGTTPTTGGGTTPTTGGGGTPTTGGGGTPTTGGGGTPTTGGGGTPTTGGGGGTPTTGGGGGTPTTGGGGGTPTTGGGGGGTPTTGGGGGGGGGGSNTTCTCNSNGMCSNVPSNGQYYLTSFCDKTVACGSFSGNCSEFYCADYVRFGCGSTISCCSSKGCVSLKVIDGGPGCSVETSAGGPVVDASYSACKYFTGGTSCGWSDHVSVHCAKTSDGLETLSGAPAPAVGPCSNNATRGLPACGEPRFGDVDAAARDRILGFMHL